MREASMSLVSTDPVVVHAIDDMLRLVGHTRRAKVRDPLRALEDTLLEMRQAVAHVEVPDVLD